MPCAADASDLYDLTGVRVTIGERRILDDISLRLPPGAVHGLVGANGSGKSTLMRVLARLRRPDAGRVRLFGSDIDRAGDRAFARVVAYLPQFTPAADGMTVRELAAQGRFPWHGPFGRFTPNDRSKVAEALEATGLSAFADRPVDALSGGERQRAWLAMTVAQDTRCLLLDEPTSALDIAHQVEVLALVRRLSRERGLGAVIVLHDINLAARLCDRIVALREGRIVADGVPEEIMTPDRLERIYGLPLGVLPHPRTGAPISYIPSL